MQKKISIWIYIGYLKKRRAGLRERKGERLVTHYTPFYTFKIWNVNKLPSQKLNQKSSINSYSNTEKSCCHVSILWQKAMIALVKCFREVTLQIFNKIVLTGGFRNKF